MASRAERRHHRERLMRKRKGHYGGGTATPQRLVDTPTPCSCWMCGNPRRQLGELTIQERREIECSEIPHEVTP